jgi:hypothetical protein
MSTRIVRYEVKPEHVAENERIVRAVYEELSALAPDGFRYATFRLDDGVSFLHVSASDGDGPTPLPQLEAFQAFQAGLRDRCAVPPHNAPAQVVGAYPALVPDAGRAAGSATG